MSKLGLSGRIARYFINSKLTPLIIISSLILGVFAVLALPREEEPQIIVPMVDVFVQMPGASAKEVEQNRVGARKGKIERRCAGKERGNDQNRFSSHEVGERRYYEHAYRSSKPPP